MSDHSEHLPVNPIAAVQPDLKPRPEHQPAEQGPPPADFATRPASGVTVKPTEHLNAGQVAALIGDDESSTDANIALDDAEGIEPA